MTTDKTDIEDFLKRSLEDKYQSKSNRMIRTVLDDGTVIIGKNRYDALKRMPKTSRLKKQEVQIKDFEDYHGITEYRENILKAEKEREARLQEEQARKDALIITKDSVWKAFKRIYKQLHDVEFEETPDTLENIAPIVTYFAKNKEFLKYGYKTPEGKFISQPSLDKGLLIVGGFGNGKTSIMKTMQKMFVGIDGYRFGRFSSHEIVRDYESAAKNKNQEILEVFWSKLTNGELYIDDVKAEPDALAYGKKNLLNILIQERYNHELKTHITCNYMTGFNGDVIKALEEFKTRYSNQVYDRLFEMFNIIEFTGKSFRR